MSEPVDTPFIEITAAARAHFESLIEKEAMTGMALRIFVDRPGLPSADVSIAFCPPGENRAGDISLEYGAFTVYVERKSVPSLQEARIDYKKDPMGGQLAITAPHLKGSGLGAETDLISKINYLIETEINPSLAGHGGRVLLVEITPQNEVVLQFGGGCQGCGMVDVTLKQGIEKNIRSQFPEVTAVVDVTDHSSGDNPYYS